MSSSKDVIYIDIEDDITAIIGKLKSSSKKIVAMVPPKRASVFNSFVNLKLLKKAATDVKKRLVLVTADDSLQALAGSLGLHVAKNLSTPPTIPEVEAKPSIPSAVIQASGIDASEVEVESEDESDTSKKSKSMKPISKNKKLPDFNRFRKSLFIGGGALLALLLLWWWAFWIAPTADVVLSADQTRIRSEFNLLVGLNGQSAPDKKTPFINGQRKAIDIKQTAQAKATGEKNKGDKASGSMTVTNCSSSSYKVDKGDGFSASGLTFVSTESATVSQSGYSLTDDGFECDRDGQATVKVVAVEAGGEYNLSAQSYQIAGNPDKVSANGSSMSGGTDDIVSVLTQEDVDKALASLADDAKTRDEILNQLRSEFSGEVYLFEETLTDNTKSPKATPTVGSETQSAQVVATQQYSIVGVSRSEIESVLTEQYESELKPQQAVTNTGLDQLVPTVVDSNGSQVKFNIIANGLAGPDLDIARLKDELTSRRYSEALKYVEDLPSVTNVEIELNPIWVGSMPRSASKITITIDSPGLNPAPTDQDSAADNG